MPLAENRRPCPNYPGCRGAALWRNWLKSGYYYRRCRQEGKDAVNDLSYVMLRATELMRLRDPNLNARYYHGINSDKYLRRLCEVNVNTGATPAIHNDKAVIHALTKKGDRLEHARDYGVIGCVEPNSNGRHYGSTASILLNLTSALELALFNGRHRHTGMDLVISKETGNPAAFSTFNEFKRPLKDRRASLLINLQRSTISLAGYIRISIPRLFCQRSLKGRWIKAGILFRAGL